MRTLSLNKRVLGFTLFELLIVVFLLTSTAALSLIAFKPALGSAKFKHASSTLISDLKNARLHAQTRGAAVSILFNKTGYFIPLLGVERQFSEKIHLDIKKPKTLTFNANGLSKGEKLTLRKENHETTVIIKPLTGEISEDAEI